MKTKLSFALSLVLLLLVIAGCQSTKNDLYVPTTEATIGQNIPMARIGDSSAKQGTVLLTKEEVRQIALDHAGLTNDEISFLLIKYDGEEMAYEVDFRCNGFQYSYKIHGYFGQIIQAEMERHD